MLADGDELTAVTLNFGGIKRLFSKAFFKSFDERASEKIFRSKLETSLKVNSQNLI